MTERVEIGYVCFKGPHISLIGGEDHGVCGSKAFARVFVSVEVEHPNPRGEAYTAEDAADAIRRVVEEAERCAWCDRHEEER